MRLELIEGLSKGDALKKYQQIDLFIDQLIIGWYGVVSLEVMALGKPVICFVAGKGLRFVPPQMLKDLPIINADEVTLEEKITEVMKMDNVQKGNLLERGIQFLEKWHDPRKIAQRVVTDYKQSLISSKSGSSLTQQIFVITSEYNPMPAAAASRVYPWVRTLNDLGFATRVFTSSSVNSSCSSVSKSFWATPSNKAFCQLGCSKRYSWVWILESESG